MGVHVNDSLTLIRGETITIHGTRYVGYYILVRSLHRLDSTCEIRVLLDFDPNVPLHPPYTTARVRGQLVPGGSGTPASPLTIDASTGGLEKYDSLVGPLDPLFFISGTIRDPGELGIECAADGKWLLVEVDRYDDRPFYVALLMEGKFDVVYGRYTPGMTIVSPARFAAHITGADGFTIVAFEPVSIQNISSGSDSRPYTWKGSVGGAGSAHMDIPSHSANECQDAVSEREQDDGSIAYESLPPLAVAETIVATPSEAYATAFTHSSSTLSSDRGSFSTSSQVDETTTTLITSSLDDRIPPPALDVPTAFTHGPEQTRYRADNSDFAGDERPFPSNFTPASQSIWDELTGTPALSDRSSPQFITGPMEPLSSLTATTRSADLGSSGPYPESLPSSGSMLPPNPQATGCSSTTADLSHDPRKSSLHGQRSSSHTKRGEKKSGNGRVRPASTSSSTHRRGNPAVYSSYEQYQQQPQPLPPPPQPQPPCTESPSQASSSFVSPAYFGHQQSPTDPQPDSLDAFGGGGLDLSAASHSAYQSYQQHYWPQESEGVGTEDVSDHLDAGFDVTSGPSPILSSRWITLKAKPGPLDQALTPKREYAQAFEVGDVEEGLPRSRSKYL